MSPVFTLVLIFLSVSPKACLFTQHEVTALFLFVYDFIIHC